MSQGSKSAAEPNVGLTSAPRVGPLRSTLRSVLSQRQGLIGAGILAFFAGLALLGPALAPHDPSAFVAVPHQAPSLNHWFGTTAEGKDVLSQTLCGARVSLLLGFGTGLCVTLIGAVVGLFGAYFGGILDELLSLVTNVFLVLPGLPLSVVLAAYLPESPWTLALVLVITGWAWNARVLRAQALTLRQRDFILAAKVMGESSFRIVFFELLPNLISLLFSSFIAASLYAIGAQVGLEFLGLGDVSMVTWGTNLYWAANGGALLTGAWWTILPTGLCVALVGFALALLNGAVDQLANPALRKTGSGPSGNLLTPVRRG